MGFVLVMQLLGVLRPLLPRLYSISSSPLEADARVQVTVAAVRYQTLGLDRIGVCSTYLSERLQVGHGGCAVLWHGRHSHADALQRNLNVLQVPYDSSCS